MTDDFSGMGIVDTVSEGYLYLHPHKNIKIIEEFGDSITHPCIIPINKINLIILLINDDKEESAKGDKEE